MRMAIVFFAVLAVTPLASAELATGKVVSMGCHNVDDVCYLSLSGYTSTALCNGVANVRWDLTTAWGKRWYATLLAAKVAGLSVTLQMSDTTCSAQNYPTFTYGSIQ